MNAPLLLSGLLILLGSCASFRNARELNRLNDESSSRTTVMVGYQPIDPIRMEVEGTADSISLSQLLSGFPNEATRLAIGDLSRTGNVSFGPFSVGTRGHSYTVILDYIKYTTSPLNAIVNRDVETDSATLRANGDMLITSNRLITTEYQQLITKTGEVKRKYQDWAEPGALFARNAARSTDSISIPVYVGVGLRIQASVTVLGDSVNLSSLTNIGIAASQKNLTGTLVIQTLGITGEAISTLMPMPNQIDESSIQSAIQALATIKSKLYDDKRVVIVPQVLAFKLGFSIDGAKELVESTLHSCPPIMAFDKAKMNIYPSRCNWKR